MPQSIFHTLCDLVDDLERVTYRLETSPIKDQLESLVERFDGMIDRTIGLESPMDAPRAEQEA